MSTPHGVIGGLLMISTNGHYHPSIVMLGNGGTSHSPNIPTWELCMKSLRYPNAMAGKESTLITTLPASRLPLNRAAMARKLTVQRDGSIQSSMLDKVHIGPAGDAWRGGTRMDLATKRLLDPYETIHDNDKAWKGQIG